MSGDSVAEINLPNDLLHVSSKFTQIWKRLSTEEITRIRNTATQIETNAALALEALAKIAEVERDMET